MQFGKFAFLSFIIICLGNLSMFAGTGQDTLDYNIGGLKFRSQEVHAKERTSLSLFPDYIRVNSNLSMSFDCDIYNVKCFGYIFRFIGVENGKERPVFYLMQNSGVQRPMAYNLELYTSETKSIDFPMPDQKQNRLHILIRYNAEQHVVKMFCNGIEKSIKGIDLSKGKTNIVFGNYGLENEDVACMSIRNIRITKDNKTIHFWPLNEYEGEVARDNVTGHESGVRNPVWLRNEHFYWEKLRSFECDAMAGVIYKQKNQQIYFINKDSLLIYSPSAEKLEAYKYATERPFLKYEHFSIYNASTDQIISYDFKFLRSPPGKKAYVILNEETMKWSKVDETTGHLKNHQHNLYWNNDNSITTFAGYSDFTYFNDFTTFDFSTNTWRSLTMSGDSIYPRSETVIVKDEKANMLYVFGGFGNKEGKQVYGGRIFKDLYSVDLTNNRVKKLMNLENSDLELLPKGSLIFNDDKTILYTLMGGASDESYLRLYQINISDKTVVPVSDTIPFYFGRMESNVYLFKDEQSQCLYCICRECKSTDKSLVSIYRIKFPPSSLIEPAKAAQPGTLYFIYSTSVLFIIGLGIGFYFLAKKRKRLKEKDNKKTEFTGRKNENAIWFLGQFKLLNPKGKDITHLLPKKLKELFLLVFFETIHSDGISTNDLSEMLWPGMERIHQKNNRGVTVSGVRKVLEEFNLIKLNTVDNLWKIECDGNCYIDIQEVNNLLKDKKYLTRPELFISLVSHGNILPGLQFEWLDKFKANFESDILSGLYEICDNFLAKKDYLSCLDAANLILEKYDQFDEIALSFKIITLNKMKGHSKAQNEFELFKKRYFAIFKEEYKLTIEEVMRLRQ